MAQKFEIKSFRDLLSREMYKSLAPENQAAYDKASADFVQTFRNKYPEGVPVEAEIVEINNMGGGAIIVKPNQYTNPRGVYVQHGNQLANLARRCSTNPRTLVTAVNSQKNSKSPSKLLFTLTITGKGEQFTGKDGNVVTTEIPFVRQDDMRIELSPNASSYIEKINFQVDLRCALQEAFGNQVIAPMGAMTTAVEDFPI